MRLAEKTTRPGGGSPSKSIKMLAYYASIISYAQNKNLVQFLTFPECKRMFG